jgi:type II secretory pathway component GspD/PulD (secretin)
MRATIIYVAVAVLLSANPLGHARADEKAPKPAPEKTFTFTMKGASWADVFAAYEKLSGLKPMINSKPTGTFTFSPAKPEQQFTLVEITSIVNEALLDKKHLLIRREMSFVVVSTAEKIDTTLAARVTVDELAKRGGTEYVQVVLKVPDEILQGVDEVRRLLTPFGSITPHKNVLIVTDTAGNVRRIKEVLDGWDKK